MKFLFYILLFIASDFVYAQPPEIQTLSPVIYLADNLDENENLGWCIDTKGRGFSETLHAHSCKPRGGDVQFKFDVSNGQIQSHQFSNKCLTILNKSNQIAFGLFDCKHNSEFQIFIYDNPQGEFRPKNNNNLCIVVGLESRKAGPFMSRNLELKKCSTIEKKYKKWIVKN